jgi:hypothetical protein
LFCGEDRDFPAVQFYKELEESSLREDFFGLEKADDPTDSERRSEVSRELTWGGEDPRSLLPIKLLQTKGLSPSHPRIYMFQKLLI